MKQQTQVKLWKLRSHPFVRDIFRREISICKGVFLQYQEEEGSKSLETLINAESNHLKLHNHLTLLYCAFPDKRP